DGDFGLASGARSDGTYERVWYKQPIAPEEITFESGVFLLTEAKAEAFTAPPVSPAAPVSSPVSPPQPEIMRDSGEPPGGGIQPPIALASPPAPQVKTLHLTGTVPPESWNRFGTKILPKLRAANGDLKVEISLSVSLDGQLVLPL